MFVCPLYCSFSVNAGKDFVFAQREHLINAALAGLSNGTQRPMLHIRGYDAHPIDGRVSVLLFREHRPDETAEMASDLIEHGLSDLRITFEALAESRTLVTLECLGENPLPAAKAVLREFAYRYPEAADAIRPCLGEDGGNDPPLAKPYGPTEKTRELAETIRQMKEQHPTWSQSRVATELGLPIETIRNAYRLMGWKWERADRVRLNG